MITVTIPLEDYARLIALAECNDMMVKCETCGAWLDRDEEACVVTEEFQGCWKAATRSGELCKSYRATVMEGAAAIEAPCAEDVK